MHIPDAVLDPKVAAATTPVALGGLAYGVRTLRGALRDRTPALTVVSLHTVVTSCVTASRAPRTLNRWRPDGPRGNSRTKHQR